ncbi:hypothetical protein F5Y12DRAFT_790760 [Xylaria sp. FL1777]|nr:hypothetical protein F5Y12DRAFT_790760 [Xylaria sp. FL1777]
MGSKKTTQAGTPADPGIKRGSPDDILLDGGVDSDDEEEGGTPLTEFVAAAPSFEDINTESPKHNGDQPVEPCKTPNQRRFIPKSMFNATRTLDWLLGRQIYSIPRSLIDDATSGEREHKQDVDDDYIDIGDVQDICPACTTPYCQAVDSVPFQSSLKLMYNDPISEKWLIGNKYVLHEAVDEHPEDEYVPLVEASRALKTLASNVPIPKVRAGWKENGKVLTITDVVPGERLYDIWWDLSNEEREAIARQVAGYIAAWRETDLGRIASLTGGPVHHHPNLFGTTDHGLGPFGSDLDLWQAIAARLAKNGVDAATTQLLKTHMPPSSPCVFTHGDLSSANIIIVRDDDAVTVAAITGLENAAALPAWAEHVAMHFCSCVEDEQWKALLSAQMHMHSPRYRAALDWWSLWTAVEDAEAAPARLEDLKTRCARWKPTAEISGQPLWTVSLGGGEAGAAKRLNIQAAAGNAVEVRVGDLVRRAIAADDGVLEGNYEDVLSEASWDEDEEERGKGEGEEDDWGEDDRRGLSAKRGLTPFHPAQLQHHTLVTSANGPPRHALEAVGSVYRKSTPQPLALALGKVPGKRGSYAAATRDFSGAESESDAESGGPRSPPNIDREESMKSFRPRGLRPLSLPSFALSEKKARGQLRRAEQGVAAGAEETVAMPLVSIRESGADRSEGKTERGGEEEDDDEGEGEEEGGGGGQKSLPLRTKRTSMFGNRAVPGGLYAALSAASSEARPRRPVRSRSEERTWADDGSLGMGVTQTRPKSMLQPSVRRDGVNDKGGVEGKGS